LLLNRDTRVAAKVYRSAVDGMIQWEGEMQLSLKNVPKTFDVQVGDLVVTSNYSLKYPANMVIGTVTDVRDETNSLFQRILVTPAVNFGTLEQMYVIDHIPDPERVALEDSIQRTLKERRTER